MAPLRFGLMTPQDTGLQLYVTEFAQGIKGRQDNGLSAATHIITFFRFPFLLFCVYNSYRPIYLLYPRHQEDYTSSSSHCNINFHTIYSIVISILYQFDGSIGRQSTVNLGIRFEDRLNLNIFLLNRWSTSLEILYFL